MDLDKEEKQAIDILRQFGWKIIQGAHLEDWDEDQEVLDDHGASIIEMRSNIAIVK